MPTSSSSSPTAARAIRPRQAEADVGADRQVREQAPLLGDVADPALFRRDVGVASATTRPPIAIAPDRALEPGEQPQQRRLADPGGPQQGRERARRNCQVDPGQDDVIAEALVQRR